MKPVQLAALAGVAGIILVGGYSLVAQRQATTASVGAARGLFLSDFALVADQAASVTIRKNAADLVLTKQGDGWVLPSKGGYAADGARVRDGLRALADAQIIEAKTSKPELYSRLSVEDPDAPGSASTLVTVADAQGKPLASVIVGRRQLEAGASESEPRNFVRRQGEALSYLVGGEFRFEADAKEWMVRSVSDLKPERVRAVRAELAGAPVAEISRPSANDTKYTLANQPEGRTLKDEFVLTRLANALAGVTFDDVAKAQEAGTDAPEAHVLKVSCFDGLLIEARGVKKPDAWWWSLHAGFEAPPTPPADASPKAEDGTQAGGAPTAVTEPSDALKAEIERLNQAWNGWAFQLPTFKSTQMAPSLEDLLAPLPKVEAPKPEAGSPAPAGDDNGPLALPK